MFTRRAFAGLAAAATAAAVQTASAQANGARRAEVEALRAFAERTHPRGREAAAHADWRARWDALAAEADTLTDGAYFIRVRRALSWFNDGHTTALPFEFIGGTPEPLRTGPFARSLPWRVRVFHDGAYVIAARDEAASLLGRRVERVGSHSTIDLIRAHATQWCGSDVWAHRWAGAPFASPALLEGFGAVSDAATMNVVAGGRTARLRPRADVGELTPFPRPALAEETWAAEARFGNYVRALPEHRALYISCDDMADLDGRTFEQFTREAFAAIENAAIERVILDLRRNGGGNNFLAEPLRKHLGRSRFNRPGGLYVLTGPITFSAAQNPATRLERETYAIFVGEPTGSSPNHYGDAALFTGEATGIVSIVSTLPWFDSYPMDERQWIMPDIFTPSTFADWAAGSDAALDAALAHRTDAAPDDLARDRIFFYARASQEAPWRPFWRG
ncbi:MAG: hypothetical protein AB7J28_09655 [Hyphomonadaceae bacterium]